jgi:threonine/homoserine/homoserine lactone efflux protein
MTIWPFVFASLAIALAPGPGAMTIVNYALGAGRRAALAAVFGALLGNLAAMTASLAGLGALIAASPVSGTIFKVMSAALLLAIGIDRLSASARAHADKPSVPAGTHTAFTAAFGVSALSPTNLLFFIAYAPQFLDPSRPFPAQALTLIIIFCACVLLADVCYAFCASAAASALARTSLLSWSRRCVAALLIGIALVTIGTTLLPMLHKHGVRVS